MARKLQTGASTRGVLGCQRGWGCGSFWAKLLCSGWEN